MRAGLFVLAFAVGLGQVLPGRSTHSPNENASVARATFTCGHYVLLRGAQILGIPISLEQTSDFLPIVPPDRGHSINELIGAAEKMGLEARGRQVEVEQFSLAPTPFIAHWRSPNHYVLVEALTSETVRFTNGPYRGTTLPYAEFVSKCSGSVVFLSRDFSGKMSAASELAANGPSIRFSSLYVDVGELATGQEEVEVDFPFVNVGQDTLEITDVKTSCSCVKYQLERLHVGPGQAASVTLKYAVDYNEGPFVHHAYLACNDPDNTLIQLSVAGISGGRFRVRPPEVNFGRLNADGVLRRRVYIRFVKNLDRNKIGISNPVEGATVEFDDIGEFVSAEDYEGLGKVLRKIDVEDVWCLRITVDSSKITGSFSESISLTYEGDNEPLLMIPIRAEIPR